MSIPLFSIPNIKTSLSKKELAIKAMMISALQPRRIQRGEVVKTEFTTIIPKASVTAMIPILQKHAKTGWFADLLYSGDRLPLQALLQILKKKKGGIWSDVVWTDEYRQTRKFSAFEMNDTADGKVSAWPKQKRGKRTANEVFTTDIPSFYLVHTAEYNGKPILILSTMFNELYAIKSSAIKHPFTRSLDEGTALYLGTNYDELLQNRELSNMVKITKLLAYIPDTYEDKFGNIWTLSETVETEEEEEILASITGYKNPLQGAIDSYMDGDTGLYSFFYQVFVQNQYNQFSLSTTEKASLFSRPFGLGEYLRPATVQMLNELEQKGLIELS